MNFWSQNRNKQAINKYSTSDGNGCLVLGFNNNLPFYPYLYMIYGMSQAFNLRVLKKVSGIITSKILHNFVKLKIYRQNGKKGDPDYSSLFS